MKRTIQLNLILFQGGASELLLLSRTFSEVCNQIVPYVVQHRCWNQVALHHLCYHPIRQLFPSLGSQMVCNALKKVCSAYKALGITKEQQVPVITFRPRASVHYDKRTYSLRDGILSLFTTRGRVRCRFRLGKHQENYLLAGNQREAELTQRGKKWFFNLVLELPDVAPLTEGQIMAVDLGENNLATTSNGTIHGGGTLRDKRDKFLAYRRRLQSNGSRSAKRHLKRISGREHRHVKEVNHIVSKSIVAEAVQSGVRAIVLEELTNIRQRIKAKKRIRSRLHRWAWDELQRFVEYKAQAVGISVDYVNPAYSSQICSRCGFLGVRKKHRFSCSSCGCYQHSDRNAAINLLRLGESVVSPMAPVNVPIVAALRPVTSFSL
jgi:putative transposase